MRFFPNLCFSDVSKQPQCKAILDFGDIHAKLENKSSNILFVMQD